MGKPLINFLSWPYSLSLYLSLSQSLWERDRDIFSVHIPFSINVYQHSRFRRSEITFSCSLPLSLSLSVSPNTHHICVDSQLAQSLWAVTALGRSSFPKICLIDWSFVFFSTMSGVWGPSSLQPARWLTETGKHSGSGKAMAGPGWVCMIVSTLYKEDVCMWDKKGECGGWEDWTECLPA